MYAQIPAEGVDAPRSSGVSFYVKVAVALGVAVGVAVGVHNQVRGGTSYEPTSLIGLRAAQPSINNAAGLRTLASIPGPSPWKELALAGLARTNRCNALTKNTPVPKEEDAAFFDAVSKVSASGGAAMGGLVNHMEKVTAGVTAPMGYFDPLGFSAKVSTGKVAFFREAEIKHGRVCMWASVGYIYGELFHPFFGGQFGGQAWKLANEVSMKNFWLLLAVAIATVEFNWSMPAIKKGTGIFGGEYKEDRIPGDFSFDPLNLKDNFDFEEMQNKEVNNGRLAMLAITGMYAQEIATGKTLLAAPFGPYDA
jgi:hypothetical protein